MKLLKFLFLLSIAQLEAKWQPKQTQRKSRPSTKKLLSPTAKPKWTKKPEQKTKAFRKPVVKVSVTKPKWQPKPTTKQKWQPKPSPKPKWHPTPKSLTKPKWQPKPSIKPKWQAKLAEPKVAAKTLRNKWQKSRTTPKLTMNSKWTQKPNVKPKLGLQTSLPVKSWRRNPRTVATRKWQPKKRCAKCDALKAEKLAKNKMKTPLLELANEFHPDQSAHFKNQESSLQSNR